MSLFQFTVPVSVVHSVFNLHSNMSLFQCRLTAYRDEVGVIYIPICHYFNLGSHSGNGQKCCIYIPICHYFNSRLYPESHQKIKFTFQYVTISIQKKLIRCRTIWIYIPICHYFNCTQQALQYFDGTEFTFQYVTISICSISQSVIIRHIYIPICHYFNITQCESTYLQQCNLHSNMSLFQSLITSSCSLCRNYLHSNMSLFQWRRGCSYRITRGKFTFQYVTISIFQKSIPFFYRVKFTFQYVTISISTTMTINLNYCIIYIPICHYFNYGLGKSRRCGRNLHSNMSLFQFCYILYFLPVSYIYIPICHYFNPPSPARASTVVEFTFQYVTISISCRRSWKGTS